MSNIISFPLSHQKTAGQWILEFEDYYFTCRSKTPKSQTTWKYDYYKVFKKLPQLEPLTREAILSLVTSTKPDSHSRRRYCLVLSALAKFVGISLNLKPFKGSYTAKQAKPRNLPDDKTIVNWYEKIPNPSWQWTYGLLATFGLRPHEVFHVDYERLVSQGVVFVKEGKTGSRIVFPLYPEWVDEFNLKEVQAPVITGSCNSDIGSRVSRAFSRYQIPFPAYSLRHAWAVRSLEFNTELSLAALQMGHSVNVHTDLYHRWISEQRQEEAFQKLMNNPNRPLPPKSNTDL